MEPRPGAYFQVNGAIFRRVLLGESQDFGGRIGRCVHARRVVGLSDVSVFDELDLAPEPEWVRCALIRSDFDEEEAVSRAVRLLTKTA